jgi:hypothetical protein
MSSQTLARATRRFAITFLSSESDMRKFRKSSSGSRNARDDADEFEFEIEDDADAAADDDDDDNDDSVVLLWGWL